MRSSSLSLSLSELKLILPLSPTRTSPKGEETFSDFYLSYTRSIQQIISANATAEFNTIWAEHERTGRSYTLLS